MSRSILDRPFMVLVRRELWEHRSLVWAPLVMASAIILLSLISSTIHGGVDIQMGGDRSLPGLLTDPEKQRALFSKLIAGLMVPQLLVGLAVVLFYLLDGLFTERRDRSILFWKSLPVSDAKTVLSKLFVAMVAVPLWIWALSLIVGLVVFGVLAAKVSGTPAAGLGVWHGGDWLAVQASLLVKLAIAALWYLPVAGWLLLVSSLAKRAPFVWATLPFIVVSIAERVVLGSNAVAAFLAGRLLGGVSGFSMTTDGGYSWSPMPEVLTSPELWLGVAAGAALIHAAIRVRRRSDDS